MRTTGVVLVLAEPTDGEAQLVEEQLHDRGVHTARFDTAEFPRNTALTARLGSLGWQGVLPGSELDLDDVSAVYYRQPPPFTLPPGLSQAEARFAQIEARFGLGGVLASLEARWLPGSPGRVADAEYKPVQLATATRAGLRCPNTVVTNDPVSAHTFAEQSPAGAVYKVFMHKLCTDNDEPKLIYTAPVPSSEIDDRVASTAHQFQHDLTTEKIFDARVVATRRGCLATSIRSDDPSARRDFRLGYGGALSYEPVEVPAPVAAGCRTYLANLELTTGVFDFCVTVEDWFFLECGPGAQWAWLEEATGAPMAALIAEELTASP